MGLLKYWRVYRNAGFRDALGTLNLKLFKPIFRPILEFPRADSTGIHLSRYGMNVLMRRAVAELGIKVDGVNLSISDSQHLIASLGFLGRIVDCSYPKYDLCNLDQPDSTYDSIVSDQVLEHLHGDPFDAFRSSFRVLKSGGVVVHATCFLHRFHPKPYDHWRFTTQGLVRLAEAAGFEVLTVGCHGNKLINKSFRSKWLWKIQVSESKINPLRIFLVKNNLNLPIYVWVIARKPEELKC